MSKAGVLKPLDFVGSSREDLKEFGGTGVLEIIENFDGATYRAVYTVKFAKAIYVLHYFQKKAKSGIKTPQQEIDLIKQRLRTAEEDYRATYKQGG